MLRLRTSRVIAIAKTPSLKATIRENSISFSVAPLCFLDSAHRRMIVAAPRRNPAQSGS